jgi:SAM-dependent methyltransferase
MSTSAATGVDAAARSRATLVPAAAIFLGAFLLFQVQPLVGRYVLPWFGGTPAVWTTCMLFFQLVLLLGYGYAHALATRVSPARQALVHVAVLCVAAGLLVLFFPPGLSWKPTSSSAPEVHILVLLAATVGAPYLLLSTTGPLLQSWSARIAGDRSPYRLYALSNAGSLAALVSYPFVFEPLLTLQTQARLWIGGFFIFVVACAACALLVARRGTIEPAMQAAATRANDGRATIVRWVALSACGSALLLATTSQLCQDVAVIPFLWVMPLAIYLASFIVAFDNPRWYRRGLFARALAVTTVAAGVVLGSGGHLPDIPALGIPSILLQALAYGLFLFAACMVCHGELARAKPPAERLTRYFVYVALGGALGGLFVGVVAPRIFDGIWEYHLAVAATWILFGWSWLAELPRATPVRAAHASAAQGPLPGWRGWQPAVTREVKLKLGGIGLMLALLAMGAAIHYHYLFETVIARSRNFYGLLRVRRDAWGPGDTRRSLAHGRITHGAQHDIEPTRPASYYSRGSGVGLALVRHHRRQNDGALRVGTVGLGVGTVAAYARPGDRFVFYEINPDVLRFAEEHFSYLADARARGASVDVALGDARVLLEREVAAGSAEPLDVLVVDAFSGDAVPVHLLTAECNALYWQRLAPDGILAIHVSNRYLDLKPVVRKLAELAGKEARWVESFSDIDAGVDGSDWILVSDPDVFAPEIDTYFVVPWVADSPPPILWTDDFSSLLPVVK